MGVDICVKGSPDMFIRGAFWKRHANVVRRCALITAVPTVQRGALVADVMSSLWADAGTYVLKSAFAKLLSATACALRGGDQSRYKRRA